MKKESIFDALSFGVLVFTTVVSTLLTWHLTAEIGFSSWLGILCGAMFWASYLAIRWMYLARKD